MTQTDFARTLLRILLVLTLLFAGINALGYLVLVAAAPSLSAYYEAHADLLPEALFTTMQRLLSAPQPFFAALALLYAVEGVGGILMWRLRPAGLHCYALARLLILLLPPLFLGRAYLALGDIMFALLYIAAYGLLLRQLGAFSRQPDDTP